jgi:hypothetical protein
MQSGGPNPCSAAPRTQARILIASLIAIVSGAICWSWLHYAPLGGGGDFKWTYVAGQDLIAGRDPFQPPDDPAWVPYPLTAAVVGLLFAPLPLTLASAVFFGLSSGLLAFGLTRKAYLPLLAFLAAPYWVSLTWAQWTPLIVASAFFPALGAVLVIKPHIAAPVVLTHLSRTAVIASGVLLLISLVIYPSWPLKWAARVGAFQAYYALLTIPGSLLLLALKRWRNRDARLLLLASVFPQRWFYDAFILWLIPRTRKEFLFTALISWVAWVVRMFHRPTTLLELGSICVLCFYLPMLVIVLRRPAAMNDSHVPKELS